MEGESDCCGIRSLRAFEKPLRSPDVCYRPVFTRDAASGVDVEEQPPVRPGSCAHLPHEIRHPAEPQIPVMTDAAESTVFPSRNSSGPNGASLTPQSSPRR